MSTPAVAQLTHASLPRIAPLEPKPPAWVHDLFRDRAGGLPLTTLEADGAIEVVRRDPFARITARIAGAATLDAADLSTIVAARYSAIAAVLARLRKHPIRYWNYVPGIVDALGPGMDRYMAFNRGRHAAYAQTWNTAEGFERSVPAASAVGVQGEDLVIDCLCSDRPGLPVENPRQIASWRYSHRYGPLPPCFARGSVANIGDRRMLLLAGTASIVGEESRHPGDTRAQVAEVIRNIEALIDNAGRTRRDPFEQLTELRIYVVNPDDLDMVEGEIRARAATDVRIESALARVCRAELLVEIEGVAAL